MSYTLTYTDIDASTKKVSGITVVGTGNNVTIPDTDGGKTVVGITGNAFYNKQGIANVTMPDTITFIEASPGLPAFGAFHRCGLTSVVLSKNITSMGSSVFRDCIFLTSATIPEGITALSNSMFSGCVSLISADLPLSLVSIGAGAFGNCETLPSVTFQENLTTIGNAAFRFCYALEEITIPATVISLGLSCFASCSSIVKADMSESVLTTLPSGIFSLCYSLTEVILNDNITALGDSCFAGEIPLSTIRLPRYLVSIGVSAFTRCELQTITIPSTVTTIGATAFKECNLLRTIYFHGNAPTFGTSCFSGSLFNSSSINATAYILPSKTGWPIPPNTIGSPNPIPTEYPRTTFGKVGCGACLVSLFVLGIGTDLFCEYIGSRLAKTTPQTIVRKLPKP